MHVKAYFTVENSIIVPIFTIIIIALVLTTLNMHDAAVLKGALFQTTMKLDQERITDTSKETKAEYEKTIYNLNEYLNEKTIFQNLSREDLNQKIKKENKIKSCDKSSLIWATNAGLKLKGD